MKFLPIYSPAHERTLSWGDPAVGIQWPLSPGALPTLSAKDLAVKSCDEIEKFS